MKNLFVIILYSSLTIGLIFINQKTEKFFGEISTLNIMFLLSCCGAIILSLILKHKKPQPLNSLEDIEYTQE